MRWTRPRFEDRVARVLHPRGRRRPERQPEAQGDHVGVGLGTSEASDSVTADRSSKAWPGIPQA